MKLSDTACKAAKAKEKPYKMADGAGLYLFVQTSGAKYWRMKYRYLGKEKVMALGIYVFVDTKMNEGEKINQPQELHYSVMQ